MPEQKENKEALISELKDLDEQIKQMHAHLEKIEDQLADLNSSKLSINKISEIKNGEEIHVPLTNGIYIKGKLDGNQLLVNVGASVLVEKNPDDVLKILDSQLTELNQYKENLLSNMKLLIARIESIQKEFE